MRPSASDMFFGMAEAAASRSTCPKRKVGAVIVNPYGHVIATGYNGAPRQTTHCTEAGCLLDDQGRCKRAVHAEMNAILQAAENGVSVRGSTLYTTTEPCPECLRNLLNSGIYVVVYDDPYVYATDVDQGIRDMLKQSGMRVVKRGVPHA